MKLTAMMIINALDAATIDSKYKDKTSYLILFKDECSHSHMIIQRDQDNTVSSVKLVFMENVPALNLSNKAKCKVEQYSKRTSLIFTTETQIEALINYLTK